MKGGLGFMSIKLDSFQALGVGVGDRLELLLPCLLLDTVGRLGPT